MVGGGQAECARELKMDYTSLRSLDCRVYTLVQTYVNSKRESLSPERWRNSGSDNSPRSSYT